MKVKCSNSDVTGGREKAQGGGGLGKKTLPTSPSLPAPLSLVSLCVCVLCSLCQRKHCERLYPRRVSTRSGKHGSSDTSSSTFIPHSLVLCPWLLFNAKRQTHSCHNPLNRNHNQALMSYLMTRSQTAEAKAETLWEHHINRK